MARLAQPNSPVKRSTLRRPEHPGRSSTPSNSTLSYTLPLRDGALGTTPLSHYRPPWTLLRADAPLIASGLPSILLAYHGHLCRAWGAATWPEIREESCYLVASILELYLPVLTFSLWLVMPGPWVILCTSPLFLTIYVLLRLVNQGNSRVSSSASGFESKTKTPSNISAETNASHRPRYHPHHRRQPSSFSSSSTPKTTAEDDDRDDNFHYIFLPSRLLTSRSHTLAVTLPRLVRLFDNSTIGGAGQTATTKIHVHLPSRLGLPLDLLTWLLQRNNCSSLLATTPSSSRLPNLYSEIRTNLQRPQITGVRLLVHGTGSLDANHLVSRLCADLPVGGGGGNSTTSRGGGVLGKLEIFTFGGVGAEMVTPLLGWEDEERMKRSSSSSRNGDDGDDDRDDVFEGKREQEQQQQQQQQQKQPTYPTISHYAFEDDPFAQKGVLYGVRKRLEGRLVGELYAISSSSSSSSSSDTTTTTTTATKRHHHHHHNKRQQQQQKKRGRGGVVVAGGWGWIFPFFFFFSSSPFSSPCILKASTARWTMDDYLEALFPEEQQEEDGGGGGGVLDQICRIEREVSEMRELASLAQSVQHQQQEVEMARSRKRLSWTALGALASGTSTASSPTTTTTTTEGCYYYREDLMPGALSLEEVRREGKMMASKGVRGYENNRLVEAAVGWRRKQKQKEKGARGGGGRLDMDEVPKLLPVSR